ncbi:hypothetical protein HOG98_05610 [bacterium]|nr:hypothetical protein [bacterium]
MNNENMSPLEAAACYKLNLLTSKSIVKIAEEWLIDGLMSPTVAILAGETSPIMSDVGPLFEMCLKELDVQCQGDDISTRVALKVYLKRIVNGDVTPFDGMLFIDDKIYHPKSQHSRPYYNFNNPNSSYSVKYFGEDLGLQYMYAWFTELLDADDDDMRLYYKDLPKIEAVKKIETHLMEEAVKLLNKINS